MSQLVLEGNSLSYLTGSAGALSIGYRAVRGTAVCFLTGAAAGLLIAQPVQGKAVCGLTGSADRLSVGVKLGEVRGYLDGGGSARLRIPRAGLTVWDAALDVYGLFKIEVRSPLDLDLARNRILGAINSIMQQIWSRADKLNYFNQETITATIVDATSEIELSDEVQNVVGPVSAVGGKDLQPIATREALRSFVDYWYGGTAPSQQPPCYFLQCTQDTTQPDRTKIVLQVPWAASGNYDLTMNVVKSVPRFTEADIVAATPIRLPAAYVELLFLPLLREWASTDHLFKTEAARRGIQQAATMAREVLGLVAPEPPVLKKKGGDVTP